MSTGEEDRPFNETELAAWQGMLRTHARVVRRLDEQLVRRHRLAVSEFDVLITLANAPDGELRMTELAESVMLSPSGLTRLVGRLEGEGLVTRRRSTSDGRSFRAALTPEGRSRLGEARPTHNAVIRALFLDRLGDRGKDDLVRGWRSVLEDEHGS